MSVNILDMVKGAVSDQVMGQIGGLLGTDTKKTSSVFETAAGSILGGMMKKASSPQGAQDIFGAVEKTDDSILGKLGDLLGDGGGTEQIQQQGSGILDMVLGGGQSTSGMVDMISKVLGLDNSTIGKLLKMAAPIVMGVVSQYVKKQGMNATGLSGLLGEQKSHLSAAMPDQLFGDLGLANFGDSANAAVNESVVAAKDTAVKSGGGLMKLIIPLGIIAALGILGWKYFNSGPVKMAPAKEIDVEVVDVNDGLLDFSTIEGIDELGAAGTMLSTGFKDLGKGLVAVSDEAGAKRFAETVTGFTGKIDGLDLGSVEGTAKSAIGTMTTRFTTMVKDVLAGKPADIKGVLQPVIDALLEKLSGFGSKGPEDKAPAAATGR